MKTKAKSLSKGPTATSATPTLALAILLLLPAMTVQASNCYLVTFEGGGHGSSIGHVPNTPITFQSGWITITSGPYANNPSEPTIAVITASSGNVLFDYPVAEVSFYYASTVDVTLTAYDASNTIVATATGPANYQPDEFTVWDILAVSLESDQIVAVKVTGASSGTAIDDFYACRLPVQHLVTFEGYGHGTPIGEVPDTPITFDCPWVTVTSGPYANNPTPPTIAVLTYSGGDILFDRPVAEVSFYYASYTTVTLMAYDASNNQLAIVSGPANYQPDGFTAWDTLGLTLESDQIKRIRIEGSAGATAIDDFRVTIVSREIAVAIDLKPQNAENAVDPFSLSSSKPVEVAVFSTADFDARTIDLSTVRLGDPQLVPTLGPLGATIVDVNRDGLDDMIFDFGPARDFGDAGALDEFSIEVLLTGTASNGTYVFGTDGITIVGPK